MMDNQDEPYTARRAGREYIAGGFFMENKIKEYMAYLEREERSEATRKQCSCTVKKQATENKR